MAQSTQAANNEASGAPAKADKKSGKRSGAKASAKGAKKAGAAPSRRSSSHKTYLAKPGDVPKRWWIVDASGKNLGRMASQIATVLRGKHKPQFTAHEDVGDFVVVINCEKVEMTGNKFVEKHYYRHSRFFGSLKSRSAMEVREMDPAFIVQEAIRGMLPVNKMTRRVILKLKAYKGAAHPHKAQLPMALTIR